jgi:hypothetical protein
LGIDCYRQRTSHLLGESGNLIARSDAACFNDANGIVADVYERNSREVLG